MRGGEPVRLSKRTGNIVTLADILDEVDPDVARLTFLLQSIDTDADLRPRRRHRAVDGEPRLLRAVRARPHRVDRPQGGGRGRGRGSRSSTPTSRRSCTSASSSCCARSRSTPTSSRKRRVLRSPHRVTTWVRDFAKTFHGFYRDCRVLSDDAALTQARLWLAEACRLGLASALAILGVHAPDEMTRSTTTTMAAPDAARVDRRPPPRRTPRSTTRGRLTIGGVELTELADAHGTPLYVYDEDELRARCAAYRDGVRRRRGAPYAAQGVPVPGDGARSSPRRASTSTSPPAASCTSRDRPASRPSAWCSTATTSRSSSCGSRSTLGVGRIVVDAFDELDRIEALVGGGLAAAPRAAAGHARRRGAHARVHRHRRRRLEVRLHRGERRRARRGGARRRSATRWSSLGFHCHIGSQILALDPVRARRRRAGDARRPTCATRRAVMVEEINLGGGLGVAYTADDLAGLPTIAEFGAFVRARLRRRLRTRRARSRAAPHGRGRALDRGAGGRHALHRRHDQGDPRRAHLRRGRRRHERQPAPGHLRRGLRGVPARTGPARARPSSPPSRASTASRATCSCATRTCPPTSRSATCSPRRSPARTATRWRRTTTWCREPAVVFVRDGASRVVVRRGDLRRSRVARRARARQD